MTSDLQPDDDDRQALLELLLAEEGLRVEDATIPRRPPGGSDVLSYAQERLWFLHQFEADSSALVIRTAVRLRGALDVDALTTALDGVLARHAILRTLITAVGGEPRPAPADVRTMPLIHDDLTAAADPEAALARVLHEESRRTFDLAVDLPVLCRLVELADDDHVLSVSIHHVAADGWSFHVFFRDLVILYQARVSGETPALDPLPIEYADYAAWQRSWVAGENLERQLDYWRAQLAGPLPVCEIPTDFVRSPVHTFDGGQVAAALDGDIAARVRALAADLGVTPFMVMLAAFEVVVARRSGHDDLLIGTPVAGRVRPELEAMIGMFLNTLVLRTDVGDDPTFAELVERVRDVALGAFDHQDVSFEQLLATLQPTRDLSRTPLFQIFFNMMNFSAGSPFEKADGLTHELLTQPDLGAKFDITLYVDDRGGMLNLLLVYNSGLYAAETMRQLLAQYVVVLEAALKDTSQRISQYSLLTAEAIETLPDDWAPLGAQWHGSVPSAVRRFAERAPDSISVADPSVRWTYGDLSRHMDRVATWLVAQGIGKGSIVAIHGHRSASLVCAIAGVLACGAGYLLLDPRYPAHRLSHYLRTVRPTGWIEVAAAGDPPHEVTTVLDELGVTARRRIGSLDDLDDEARGEQPPDAGALAAIDSAIGPDDVACLTFTSGSTGDPKAVVGRHGSLTHFLPWQSERFDVGPTDRFSMLSGLAHDPIQRDIFWALWVGGAVVAPNPDEIASPGYLASWLRDQRITVAHLTPAMGQLIADGSMAGRTRAQAPELRRAIFIGDVLTRREVRQFRQLAPNAMVANFYGTTETQRASGHHVVDDAADGISAENPRAREVLPLGVGIPGTQLLVRTRSGARASFGEIGEIWFRSPHLALGYHDRPADTADRFSAHPSGVANDRLYRTGDIGRYLANGEVEFLGRADDQVQVRGFRVELGEVRAALAAQPGIRDAVVVARRQGATASLVGYVVAAGRDVDLRELRTAMRARLPAHMVPSDLVLIDAIPLTPNGKVDRAALPAPDQAAAAELVSEPRDLVERHLLGWWEEILGRSGIGIHDDFFDLGGYSLLATRLFATIEAATGKRLPVSALFEAPTIAELANVVRGDDRPVPWSSLVPVQPKGTQRPFFYVAPYMISVLQFAHLGEELGDDQPLYGFQPQGLDGVLPVHTSVEEMAAHYIAEMRQVQPRGPYRIGGHCSGTWVAFEMARQLEAAGESIDTLLLVDQGPPEGGRLPIKMSSYLLGRARFYLRDGRLLHAVKWQGRILLNALLLRRIGTETAKFTENVRAAHRAAYKVYKGGVISSDIVLVRSEESLTLGDKFWYLHWREKTTGAFRHAETIGTHANLLEQPYVAMLADHVRWAFSLSASDALES